MHVQNTAQNSSFLDEIDREATKVRVRRLPPEKPPWNRHFANNHLDLHNNLLGIIFSGFKAYLQRVRISSV